MPVRALFLYFASLGLRDSTVKSLCKSGIGLLRVEAQAQAMAFRLAFESTGPEWVTNRFLPTWRESYISKDFASGVQMAESCRVRIVILTVSQSGAAPGAHGIGRREKAEAALLRIGNR